MTLINIQHGETGRIQEWPIDNPIPHGWARTSELFKHDPTMKPELKNGQVCLVKIRGQKKIMRRVFKWNEKRFGEIPCLLFSAPINRKARVTWDKETHGLTIAGPKVPASEVSVPYYDLLICEPVINAPENANTWTP